MSGDSPLTFRIDHMGLFHSLLDTIVKMQEELRSTSLWMSSQFLSFQRQPLLSKIRSRTVKKWIMAQPMTAPRCFNEKLHKVVEDICRGTMEKFQYSTINLAVYAHSSVCQAKRPWEGTSDHTLRGSKMKFVLSEEESLQANRWKYRQHNNESRDSSSPETSRRSWRRRRS